MAIPVTSKEIQLTQLVGVDKAAATLDVSIFTIRKWVREGKVASVKLGSRVLIPADAIQQVIDEATRPAVAQEKPGA
jgi:excisionase family DNA binding protein